MPNWNLKFKPEYDYIRTFLANEGNFDETWRPLVRELHELMTDTGFDPGRVEALDRLRKKVKQGEARLLGHKTIGEDQGILTAVKAWEDKSAGKIDSKQKMRAAALKVLRHVYLLNRSGNRQVWIHSLPDAFVNWASDDINSRGTTDELVKTMLRSKNERFSVDQKKYFASAAQHGLAWCQKAGIVLSNAANADAKAKTRDAGRDMVKRWFKGEDAGVTADNLDTFIATLTKGFKDITATINGGRIVLTDYVPLRGATSAEDLGWLGNNAFTFGSRGEGMDVVYIENGFFTPNAGNVLSGQAHYTRIFVHELTHLVAGTADVNNGGKRYAWFGIGPHAGYPGSDAIRNADNWACFAADCGGAMTEGQRTKALKIV